jgi:hypothetical protein
MLDGGWPAVMARNTALARTAREILVRAIGGTPIAPEAMLGAMAAVELPPGFGPPPGSAVEEDPLQAWLRDVAGIEVPLVAWPRDPARRERRHRLVRVSAHLHNDVGDYVALADALREARVRFEA